jgi:hypothetical protein
MCLRVSIFGLSPYTHTHTHTHIYIYIYFIWIWIWSVVHCLKNNPLYLIHQGLYKINFDSLETHIMCLAERSTFFGMWHLFTGLFVSTISIKRSSFFLKFQNSSDYPIYWKKVLGKLFSLEVPKKPRITCLRNFRNSPSQKCREI